MREARVSLVMPCFNAGAFVGEAIASALGQTRPPDEIVVVDDGSSDDSARVIRAVGDRVRYVHQANGGIGAARNRGMALASGDFVAFLDADDLWPRDSLEARLALFAADPDLGCAFGKVEAFHTGRAVFREVSGSGRLAGAVLVRRDVIDRIGSFEADYRVGEMIDWVARADAAGCAFRDTGTVVLRRRLHGANTVLRDEHERTDYLRALRAAIERRRAPAGHP